MEGRHSVYCNQQEIGQVDVSRQGLYYRFSGRCKYHGDNFCRLMIRSGDVTHSLGVMVPEGPEFTMEKQLPVKQFGNEKPYFYVPSREADTSQGKFVPISQEEPFAYLTKLKRAFFSCRDGSIGAWIPEKE